MGNTVSVGSVVRIAGNVFSAFLTSCHVNLFQARCFKDSTLADELEREDEDNTPQHQGSASSDDAPYAEERRIQDVGEFDREVCIDTLDT